MVTDVLLTPIRPAERFADLNPSELSDLFQAVHKVSSVIERHFGGTSLTIAVQDGPDSGQTVMVGIESCCVT
jgi:bis(5'-adenosyl)-triphosphatase